jgi:hypothetical protein
MGFHFAKESAIDGNLNELEPEVLVYEPEKDGRLQLVAVEFVVPFEIAPETDRPPTLFNGRPFTPFHDNGVWGLHAWIFKNNPSGMFADWQPDRELRRRVGVGAHVALKGLAWGQSPRGSFRCRPATE